MLVADKRAEKKINRVERIEDALILYSGDGMIKLQPKSEGIIRVIYTKKDKFSDIIKPGVICTEGFGQWDFKEAEDEIQLNTDKLSLRIRKETASIGYYNNKGELLLKERDYESKNLEEFDSFQPVMDEKVEIERIDTPDGTKEIIKNGTHIFDQKLYKTRLYLEWQEDEALYGLGQNEVGQLNLRGTTVYLHQANMKIAIPLLVSSLGYGILVDTYSPMIFSDSKMGSYLYTEADLEMDFYFIYGNNIDGVIQGYRYLTGKAVMLPKWAFGFIQSQERYETGQELIDIVKEHRKRKIGLDGIVLDWCSWEGTLWGQKTFDPMRFPNPEAMMNELHGNHANLMVSIWPNMSKECDNYKEFKASRLLLGASSIYDSYQEDGRKLYWKQVMDGLFRYGIDAWWCDSSEPFTPEWNHIGKPEPSTMYHEYFETTCKYIPAWLTNSYGLYHARTLYEGQRGTTKEKRVINLTRSGYTGQQRYGTILWSGDISASWNTLKSQITAGLNFCASGLPYWTLDIGAFFVRKGTQWFWDGDYDQGYDDLGYRELFTRWYQLGCFLPIFRSHGTDFRRELWNFGDQGDVFYEALIKMNQIRYQLMPYIYTMAAKVWLEDYTILRMLAFDFAFDPIAREIDDQFMFGNNIMVCPVTVPMYYEKNSLPLEEVEKVRKVYLPEGTGWFNFWTERYYEGGQFITTEAPIDKIPLFVKAGSILPMTQFMNYTDELPDAPIEVRVYPGMDTEFDLYEDEGNRYCYEEGEYALTKMVWCNHERKLDIQPPVGIYQCMQKDREYHIRVINSYQY